MSEKIKGGCFCGAIQFTVEPPELYACFCHCAGCGTCISYENANRGGEIDITLNTLDDPSALEPRSHIWIEDKQPWLVIGDDLPQYGQTVS